MKQRSRRRRSFPCMDISPWLPGTLDLRSKQGAVLYSLLESVLHSRLWLILPSIKTKLHLLVMGSRGRIAQVVLQILEGFFALACPSKSLLQSFEEGQTSVCSLRDEPVESSDPPYQRMYLFHCLWRGHVQYGLYLSGLPSISC